MLLLGTEFRVGALTLYADHASPSTFHYLPGSPRLLSTPGRAGAQLIRYRGGAAHRPDDLGGGLLALDVHLGIDAQTLDEVRRTLQQRVQDVVSLVPVTFAEGQVRLAMLCVDSRAPSDGRPAASFLVERIIGTAMPSLFGSARAIFSIGLSAEGATLIEQAL